MSDKPKIVFDVNIYARTYNEDGLVTDFFSIQGEHLDDATFETLRLAIYEEVNRHLDAKITRLRSV